MSHFGHLDSASIVPFRNRILILASALKSVDNPPPLQRFVAQMQPTAGFSKHFWQPTDGTALILSEAQLGARGRLDQVRDSSKLTLSPTTVPLRAASPAAISSARRALKTTDETRHGLRR
jgi:hypothetical protein